MIIVKLAGGIRDHFPARASEWGFAALLLWIGYFLAVTPGTFVTSAGYAGLAALADEATWRIVCFVVGSLRLLALVINGTFATTWYGRWSPHVRGACAFLSCGVWLPLMWGFLLSERPLLINGFVGVVLAIDVYNIRRVWADAGRSDQAVVNASEP